MRRFFNVVKLAFAPIENWNTGWQMLVAFVVLVAPPALSQVLSEQWPLRARLEFSLILAFVAIVVAAIRLHKQLDDVKDGTPKLVCKGVSHHPNWIQMHGSPPVPMLVEAVIGNPEFYHLKIANEPSGVTDRKIAESVAARVQIFHEDGRPAADERLMRWEDSPGPGDPGVGKMADRLLPLDIPPSGVEYKLDIAMKDDDDDSFHTPNNETVLKGSPDWKEEEFKFPPGKYIANVHLRGANVVTNLRCQIVNKGRGSKLIIVPLGH